MIAVVAELASLSKRLDDSSRIQDCPGEDMMAERIERFSLFATAAVSVIISILDLSGLLETIPVLAGRTSALSLLVLGIAVGYLAIERRSKLDRIEQRIIEGFDNTISSLKGAPVTFLGDSQQLFEYVIRRMRGAEKSVDDLSWGMIRTTRRTEVQARVFVRYEKARLAVASKSHMQYREVLSFPETDVGKLRLERAEQITGKEPHGYQLRYYDCPHKNVPPLPLFMIIDSEEVILAHHRGVYSQQGETYLAIRHPDIAHWFQDYYNSIWQGAIPIKETGRSMDSEVLEQIRQRFSVGPND